MNKIRKVKGQLSYSYCGDLEQVTPVEITVEDASFPIPEDMDYDSIAEYTVSIKLTSTTILMDITYDDNVDKFYIEDIGDIEWLHYFVSQLQEQS